MITFSQEQLGQRWDNAPQSVREAMVSEENSALLQKALTDNGLPPELFPILARLTGWTMLGLLPVDQLAKELEEQGKMNSEKANFVAAAAARGVISPLREQERQFFLADLMDDSFKRESPPTIEGPAVSTSPSLDVSFTSPTPAIPEMSAPVIAESAPASGDQGPAPMFLHQETEAVPVKAGEAAQEKVLDFSAQPPADLIKDIGTAAPSAPSAQVQLGDIQTATFDSFFSQKQAIPEPKVVSYSQFEPKAPAATTEEPMKADILPSPLSQPAAEPTPKPLSFDIPSISESVKPAEPATTTAPEEPLLTPAVDIKISAPEEKTPPLVMAEKVAEEEKPSASEPASPPKPEKSSLFGGLFKKFEKLKTLGTLPSEIKRPEVSREANDAPAPPLKMVNYAAAPDAEDTKEDSSQPMSLGDEPAPAPSDSNGIPQPPPSK